MQHLIRLSKFCLMNMAFNPWSYAYYKILTLSGMLYAGRLAKGNKLNEITCWQYEITS